LDAFLLQNWVSINAASALTSVAQGEDDPCGWLDISAYEDVAFHLEVKSVTGTVTMYYDTSPSRDETSFSPLLPGFTMATGVRVDQAIAAHTIPPHAQYLRWRLTNPGGAGSWGALFRIWVSAYSPT
jgi:hypothetical protein